MDVRRSLLTKASHEGHRQVAIAFRKAGGEKLLGVKEL